MKAEINKASMLWIPECAAFQYPGGENREPKDDHRNDVVRAIGNSTQPAVQSGSADEPPNRCRNRNGSQCGHKVLHAVVVISIAVFSCSQGKEAAIGPEKPGSQPHG